MWYNTKEGIGKSLETLKGFHNLIAARRRAGYERDEELDEFYILGNWNLDSSGNTCRCLVDIKKDYPGIPNVLTKEEFFLYLRKNPEKYKGSYSWVFNPRVPPENIKCPECGKSWTLEDAYDVIEEEIQGDNFISLEEFVGETIADVKASFAMRTDVSCILNSGDNIILNEKNIDLTPRVGHEEWNEKHPDNKIVENQFGWLGKKNGVDDSYVIQKGDAGYFYIRKFHHVFCEAKRLNDKAEKEFTGILTKAGISPGCSVMMPIKNEYGSFWYRGPWYNVKWGKMPPMRIGWRKRVIEIDWSNWGLDLEHLFEGEDVTKGKDYIHAHTNEKAIEYLGKIKDLMSREPYLRNRAKDNYLKKISL